MSELTGVTRYRLGLFNRLVLQVEEIQQRAINLGMSVDVSDVRIWRDARVEDLPVIIDRRQVIG
jgi:hypothetical protein